MRLTANQVKDLPNGTMIKLFFSGSSWDEDFSKVIDVIKVDNKLYHFTEFVYIDELNNHNDGYEIEAAIKKLNLKGNTIMKEEG